jgi:hypothetical protein
MGCGNLNYVAHYQCMQGVLIMQLWLLAALFLLGGNDWNSLYQEFVPLIEEFGGEEGKKALQNVQPLIQLLQAAKQFQTELSDLSSGDGGKGNASVPRPENEEGGMRNRPVPNPERGKEVPADRQGGNVYLQAVAEVADGEILQRLQTALS